MNDWKTDQKSLVENRPKTVYALLGVMAFCTVIIVYYNVIAAISIIMSMIPN